METEPHPFYAGLERIAKRSDGKLTIASMATAAKLDNSTVRKGIKAGSAPSTPTVKAFEKLLGMTYAEIVETDGEIPADPDAIADAARIANISRRLSPESRTALWKAARGMALEEGVDLETSE